MIVNQEDGEQKNNKLYADIDAFEGEVFREEWDSVRHNPLFLNAITEYLTPPRSTETCHGHS